MSQIISLAESFDPRIRELRDKIAAHMLDHPDDTTNLHKMTAELNRLNQSRRRMAKVEADTDDEADYEADIKRRETIKAHIRSTIIPDKNIYYYIHKMEKFLLYRADDATFAFQSERSLKNHHPKLVPGSEYYDCFIEVLKEEGRWYYDCTSSFKDRPGKFNMLITNLVEPIDGDPHPIFDILVRSISGDKAENIEHIEQVMVAKWNKPDQYLLPVICLSDGGGTGKSLFVGKVVSTFFGRSAVSPNCTIGEVTGQFNGHLAGKLAVLINENCEESYNHNSIKRISGSETITFTVKNQMPYDGDNTALFFVSGNSIGGAIRLEGGDVDRRFSVIKGTSNLESYVAPWLETERGAAVSARDAKSWIIEIGQSILSDPAEVGRWLNALISRHGKPTHVPALHGADYHSIASLQTSLVDQIFEVIFDDEFTYIPRSLLYEFYRYEADTQRNNSRLGKKKFYQMAELWIGRKNLDIVCATANWDGSTKDVFISKTKLGNRSRPNLRPNEGYYVDRSETKPRWKVAL